MRATEISNKLDELYNELETVRAMSEKEVSERYNADCKKDITELIEEEIEQVRNYEGEDWYDDDGMDYVQLQLLQGMAVTHW